MKVSILINNHNYRQFLADAIDSALAQTYRDVEVVVCDDGSTDGSWALIQAYGTRIRSWHSPENLGQGSSMNAGMALCSGDWVLFLDADDMLEPHAVAACLPLMAPGVAKVQFPLRCIDAQGNCLGREVPYLMHDGDVTPIVRQFGSYAGPPASGNVYRRTAIARYFPLDLAAWRRAADTPPFVLSAFNGTVVSSRRPLGCYRLHSRENRARGTFGNVACNPADTLRVDEHRRRTTLALLAHRDGIRIEGPFLPSPWNIRTRAVSWRMNRERHPFSDDSAGVLLRLHTQALAACPGYTWMERVAAQAWLAAVLLLPTELAIRLALTNTSNRVRRRFRQIREQAL